MSVPAHPLRRRGKAQRYLRAFFVFFAGLLAATSASASPMLPVVTSGTLVAQFQANAETVGLIDDTNHVSSWTATNDESIVLNAAGTNNPGNIAYDPTGMNGNPTIVVDDPTGNRYLTSTVAILGNYTETTIFWLGYYAPDRTPDVTTGQYAYTWGQATVAGRQMGHQYEPATGTPNRVELYNGTTSYFGDVISGYNDQYTVWHTYYGLGDGNGHEAFANDTNLNVTSPTNANYDLQDQALVLFAWQSGFGTSTGWNFMGNMSELLIYDGILDATDTAAISAYLQAVAVPEPAMLSVVIVAALGFAVVRRRRHRTPAAT